MTKKNKKKEVKNGQKSQFQVIQIPRYLLEPVGNFLRQQVYILEKRKREITKDDPFKDTDRLIDNASPDTDAAEQFGHARASAIAEQLDRKIIQTRKALSKVRIGTYGICEDCGKMIDTDRLMIYPEATLCASCQKKREK